MKTNPLEKMLQQEAPPPDPAARLAARRAALAEFARVHSSSATEHVPRRGGLLQALLGRLRLSRDPQSRGRDSMPWYTRRVLVGGAASVCIALVGVAMVWNTLRHQPEVTALKPVAAVPAATEPPACRMRSEESAVRHSPAVNGGCTTARSRRFRYKRRRRGGGEWEGDEREAHGPSRFAAPVAGEQKLDDGYSNAVASALTTTPVAQPPAAAEPTDALSANAAPAPAPESATERRVGKCRGHRPAPRI